MNAETFDKLFQDRVLKMDKVLGEKAKEYAVEGEMLHNIKTVARLRGTNTRDALWGMAVKHLASVNDLVEGILPNTEKIVDEKIGDMINYLFLLEAVLKEERANEVRSDLEK